ncbi:MAG TPA: ABC transporter permease [Polyangiaceae bacterium]|nr:ABC transporter permease [Polyangiaceae bacterium]HYQ29735.1 ABC transporter permease [Polyangiaceae bacterium]
MARLRSTLPYDPRTDRIADAGWLGAVGRSTIRWLVSTDELLHTFSDAIASLWTPGLAARETVRRVITTQIMYTGVQALSLVSVIAFLLGSSIIIQTNLLGSADGELLGKVLVAVVLRELAPLVTAIVIAGRSGTAMATELGNMKVNSEVLALSSLGIDPPRFIVLPRLVASIVSVLVLMIYFSVVAIFGAFTVAQLTATASWESLYSGVSRGVMPFDFGLFLLKGVGLGAIVGWLCCHYGLKVKSSPTEVPQQASRAVVMSLLCGVVYSTFVTALFYWLVGPPIR